MADTALCLLTGDNDMEVRAAHLCMETVWLGCQCPDACEHGYVLSCVRTEHPDTELHRDIDGIEWRTVDE